MARRACDGAGLLEAFRAAVANLEAHVDEINSLNVYPVPDGDTGSNMYATVKAALEEAEGAAGESAERVAAAISFGALMGARGNSGVITSQIFRGMAEGLGGKGRFNGLDLAHALSEGARTAYSAVAKPVEGTILTVIRESRDSGGRGRRAQRGHRDGPGRHGRRRREVGRPDPEPAGHPARGRGRRLRWPGTVPAVPGGAAPPGRAVPGGGREVLDEGRTEAVDPRRPCGRGLRLRDDVPAPGGGFEAPRRRRIRDTLETMGESVLVAGDARALKVHVHNERPDQIIGYGLTLGSLSRISVENLDNQARDVRETRAAAFTGDDGAKAPADGSGVAPRAAPAAGTLPLGVIAVVAGEGLAAIFRDFGVSSVVQGGQSANPSTGELLEAVKAIDAREILILPNNPNVVLAARQVAGMSERPVTVVPTRNAAEGFAALLALDPTADAATNAGPMTEASRAIQTVVVTEAVRDATIGGRKVKHGQTIALDPDDGLVAVNGDREKAVLAAMTALKPGFELVTLFYGDGADLAEAESMAHKIGALVSGIEVEVRHGGQPYYRYLISAE